MEVDGFPTLTTSDDFTEPQIKKECKKQIQDQNWQIIEKKNNLWQPFFRIVDHDLEWKQILLGNFW